MTTVLTFHRIVHRPDQAHDLSWDSFLRLADSVSESTTHLESPSSGPAIAMTFDDGTEDHLRAAEELRNRGLPATFFVPAGHIGAPGRLNAGQVRELVSMGHVVGSHALHHRPLARLSPQQLLNEVRESRVRLEEICGQSVIFFAPPGGIAHQALTTVLRSEGYRACRSMRWGIYRDEEQRWTIPCLPVTEYTWRRGWIAFAMDRHSMPLVMRLAFRVKSVLPSGAASRIRARLHARVRRPGER
jgi:peptidoglycan/xylan/chitin deacetylase (PgdA/CDA1 family)